MKKRIVLAFLLTVMMVFTFAACSNTASNTPAGGSSSTAPADSAPSAPADPAPSGEVDKSDWIKMDLSFASYLPKSRVDDQKMNYARDALEKYMPGLVTITEFYDGTLLKQDNMLDGIKAGTADFGYIDFTTVPGDFPLSKIWNYPSILVESQVGGTAAYVEWVNTRKPEEYKDTVFLIGNAAGPSSFVTNFQVNSVADLNGKQLRGQGAASETLKTFGVNPISMTTGEVYEAVRNGMIAGTYQSFGSIARLGLTEIAPYATMVPMGTAVYGWAMNRDKFETMPESQQEAFLQAWSEAFWEGWVPYWERMQPLNDEAILPAAATATWGYVTPGTPEYDEFYSKCDTLLQGYIDELDAKGFDGQKEVDAIQAVLDKWCAGWWNFERHCAPYKAAVDDTLEEFKADYPFPEPMPEPVPWTLWK